MLGVGSTPHDDRSDTIVTIPTISHPHNTSRSSLDKVTKQATGPLPDFGE
jgi:hypothetical protein